MGVHSVQLCKSRPDRAKKNKSTKKVSRARTYQREAVGLAAKVFHSDLKWPVADHSSADLQTQTHQRQETAFV
jgi:hypothetical protein